MHSLDHSVANPEGDDGEVYPTGIRTFAREKYRQSLTVSGKLLQREAIGFLLKMRKRVWWPGSAQARRVSLLRSPDPLAGFMGPLRDWEVKESAGGEGANGGEEEASPLPPILGPLECSVMSCLTAYCMQ